MATTLAKLQLGSVRRQIGIVPQDSLLFEGSVRDNIALTAPDATSAEIEAAARVACAHDFIMELPEGYASSVGERGSGLFQGAASAYCYCSSSASTPESSDSR